VKQEPILEVPARSTLVLEYTLEPVAAGHFEVQGHVFVDDGSLREFVLKVEGEASGAVEGAKPPENKPR
jgi:hypothetical protein